MLRRASLKLGGFLRYASGAIKGQWGTEWWFRDQHSLFKGTGPLGSITFSEQRFAVVHNPGLPVRPSRFCSSECTPRTARRKLVL